MHYLLSETLWHTDDYLGVIDGISVADLEEFIPDLLAQTHIELLAHGNFNAEEVLHLGGILEKNFNKPSLEPISPTQERTIQVPPSKPLVHQLQVEDVNSAVQVYYQAGPKNIRQTVTLDMIQHLLEKPFYHRLRTMEQLGYIVWSGYREMNKVEGINFIIQSSTKDPVYLQGRIDSFLEDFETSLNKISGGEFAQFQEALIARRLEQPKNLQEETHRYWNVISTRSFDFRHLQEEIDALRELELSDVKQAFRTLFYSPGTVKTISVQAVGKAHKQIRPLGFEIKESKEFKKEMEFYNNPDGEIRSKI
ncbi:MAG: hypothetical protein GY866_05655 [Proteobacteria bacterium]|nr:hypothetical protein [Pseudomonadota bacterium]